MQLDAPPVRSVGDLVGEGHAAVFGAPGSGKTRLAIELVAERVAGGLDPAAVLMLAATRRTAASLRDALAVRLGLTTRGALARTANAVAYDLVRARTGRAVTLLTGAEHDQVIGELLEAQALDGGGPDWPEALSADVRALRGFRSELRDLMMRAVEQGVGPAELAELGRRAERPEWIAAARFLAEYAEVKEQLRPTQYDSAELGAYAAAIVRGSLDDPRDAAALGALAGLRLIVVDDAQEATEGGAALLGAFAARGVEIVAFGDPDVASNGFRGGRADLLGSLSAALGGCDVRRVELPVVHRGRAAHRELFAQVAAHIGTALGGTHRAAVHVAALERDGDPLEPVVGIEASSPGAEGAQVATLLRERHLLDGVPWSAMAVVLRSGAEIPSFARALAAADVPVSGGVARTALRDAPGSAALLAAASCVLGLEPLSPESATALLTGPLGRLDRVGLRRLRLALRHEELAAGGVRSADELLVEALGVPGGFATIDAPSGRRAGRLAALLDSARRSAARGATVEELLWLLWHDSGLEAEWAAQAAGSGVLADEANRSIDAVVALFAAARRFVEREPGAPARRFVDEMRQNALPEDSLAPERGADAVVLATPPALIGREFDVVVVAGLQDGVWPNLRPRGTLLHAGALGRAAAAVRAGAPLPEPESASAVRAAVRADELRLFALAISRARRQVVLACTATDDEQPSVLMGFAPARVATRRRRPLHLRGLVGALRRDASAGDREAAAALALLAEQGVPGAHPDDWYGLAEPTTTAPLVDLDGDPEALVPVSPSQIDRVEESPLGWFVDHVAQPPSGLAASIGTIVHAVVEEAAASEGEVDVETLWASVERRWRDLRFDAGWVAERERRGARRMTEGAADYLRNAADDGVVVLGAEGRFTLVLGRVRISGTIDRVEASPDGTTVIVDLKTGRTPPTAAQTAAHPQLAAYQLAARAGVLPNAGRFGGAKLVYVARPVGGRLYTERAQQPFDDEAEAAFRERLDEVARIMAGAAFESPVELAHGSRFGDWRYRVHLVPAVSA
ncbi:PD-(D/E)XK nuclease family protein [Agromyces aurantiacus]|uniref:DNA 3'-5' helicase n=1 Tax=Agromyces aurantiacus TaxID=165814 RepID=A0ABV9RBE4_9MICO|nr:UrvD/REP family ATP-dependent DNA helicase [Agromyces aurantiacus]MBM7505292.1 superfamily I DNA/RNA helicase/RecB family exonuclease [Agromyces aurantiacus]